MNKVLMSSKNYDWRTPPSIFNPLDLEFDFTIDAAANDENALLPRYWTKSDNGALQDWTSERVFCNPPYGKFQKPFIEKAGKLEADVAVLLLPARPDTIVWQDIILPLAEVRFVRGRIRFVGAKHPAPFPSAICIFRKNEL